MSTIPEFGAPDRTAPEASERDFALARRRDGAPVDAEAFARVVLAELYTALSAAHRGGPKISNALRHVKAALAEIEEG